MAEISKIKMPNNTSYDLKDAAAREQIENLIVVSTTQPSSADNKIWINDETSGSVQVPTVSEMNSALAGKVDDVQIDGSSVLSNGVANIQHASSNRLGLTKPDGISISVINNQTGALAALNGRISVICCNDTNVKDGNNTLLPISTSRQHMAVFYGLSKVAGVDLANETVTLGTYPETSKTAIRSMIGAGTPLDVQINGTSIVSSGVANIPLANNSTYGVVCTAGGTGIAMESTLHFLHIVTATDEQLKAGTSQYAPIVPVNQHKAIYYGLSKLAGVDLASETVTVGTYTTTASAAIRTMLGAQAAVEVIRL